MKVLMLTWEFPPAVTGGLGMACYGMTRALLKKGVSIDLIMPARALLYFPLRQEADAEALPYRVLSPRRGKTRSGESITPAVIRLLAGSPGAYFPGTRRNALAGGAVSAEHIKPWSSGAGRRGASFEPLPEENELFRQVNAFTATAVETASKLDFDLIHAHDWLTLGAGMVLREATGKPLVAHIHSTEYDRAGGFGNARIHMLESAGISAADRVITVSRYSMQSLKNLYGTDENRVSIIHNAYSMKNAEKKKKRIFRETTILFMGRITMQKGPDYFLETARRILRVEKNARFIMAGKGDLENSIIHASARFELGAKFLFAGFLNRDEVEEMLKAADIFVLPSVSEPFGIVCLEAMSYGTVAVISKKSGVSEVVENAFKVDFWDVDKISEIIIGLIRNPGRLREVSEKGRAEVEKLQWDESADRLVSVYADVLKTPLPEETCCT